MEPKLGTKLLKGISSKSTLLEPSGTTWNQGRNQALKGHFLKFHCLTPPFIIILIKNRGSRIQKSCDRMQIDFRILGRGVCATIGKNASERTPNGPNHQSLHMYEHCAHAYRRCRTANCRDDDNVTPKLFLVIPPTLQTSCCKTFKKTQLEVVNLNNSRPGANLG